MSNTHRRQLANFLAEIYKDKTIDLDQRLEAAKQLSVVIGPAPKDRKRKRNKKPPVSYRPSTLVLSEEKGP